jgi:hypothetical protein
MIGTRRSSAYPSQTLRFGYTSFAALVSNSM